jgi:hypothetical protein
MLPNCRPWISVRAGTFAISFFSESSTHAYLFPRAYQSSPYQIILTHDGWEGSFRMDAPLCYRTGWFDPCHDPWSSRQCPGGYIQMSTTSTSNYPQRRHIFTATSIFLHTYATMHGLTSTFSLSPKQFHDSSFRLLVHTCRPPISFVEFRQLHCTE